MPMFRRAYPSFTLVSSLKLVPLAAVVTTLLLSSSAYAATFGHARILSKAGQALAINVPVSNLTEQDLATLKLAAAPAADWSQAGLTPPVDLSSLSLQLTDEIAAGKYVLKVRSPQTFSDSVADLLLDLGTASGQQRYQVSLLTQAAPGIDVAAAGTAYSATGTGTKEPSASALLQNSIQVKRGDTLFKLARSNAVSGVTVYQMMVAMQRTNPQAFMHGNMNLLRAGASLSMPDANTLTALSDAQARKVFQQHAAAFAKYRQGKADNPAVAVTNVMNVGNVTDIDNDADAIRSGTVVRQESTDTDTAATVATDQLRLSGADDQPGVNNPNAKTVADYGTTLVQQGSSTPNSQLADSAVATNKGIADAQGRVSQLEENVKNLNQAFQSQGGAATELVLEGAKGIGQSLSSIASSVVDATSSAITTSDTPTTAQDANQAPNGTASKPTGTGGSTVDTGGDAGRAGGSTASDTAAGGTAGGGTAAAGTSSVNAASTTTNGGGLATGPITGSDPTTGSGSASTGAADTSVGVGPAAGNASSSIASSGNASVGTANTTTQDTNKITPSTTSKATSTVSWLLQNFLAIIGGGLALILVLVVWLLRRATSEKHQASGITPAMVQQKLDEINLDLNQPEPTNTPNKSV